MSKRQPKASIMLKHRISVENILKSQNSLKRQSNQCLLKLYHRKDHNLLLYFWNIQAQYMMPVIILIYLHANFQELTLLLVGLSIWVFSIIPIIFSLIQLNSPKQFLKLFFLVDNIFIAQAASSIVLGTLFTIKGPLTFSRWTFALIGPVFLHLNSTLTRSILLYANWSKWNVILYKFNLTLVCMFYVAYSCYFLVSEYTFTGGRLPSLDAKIKQYFIIYTFANFAYVYEIYSKVTDFDGTALMKSNYKLINPQPLNQLESQLDQISSKIIKNQQQNLQSNYRMNNEDNLYRQSLKINKASRFAQQKQKKLDDNIYYKNSKIYQQNGIDL